MMAMTSMKMAMNQQMNRTLTAPTAFPLRLECRRVDRVPVVLGGQRRPGSRRRRGGRRPGSGSGAPPQGGGNQ